MQKARRHSSIAAQAPTACRRTVSGTISLPCPGCFSPFPYGTGSLSISKEYLALPDGAGRFRQDFSGPALLRILLTFNDFTLTGLSPSAARLSRRLGLCVEDTCAVLQPHADTSAWFRLFPVRSPLLRKSLFIFFSSRYLDVSVPWVGWVVLLPP